MSKLSETTGLIVLLPFLIHRRHFHVLNWALPFLAALSTELPLWKWPILSLSTIFRRGQILSCSARVLEQFFICAVKRFLYYIQIIWSVRAMRGPDHTAFLAQSQCLTSSGTQRQPFPSWGPSLLLWTAWKMQTAHVWGWLLWIVDRSSKLRHFKALGIALEMSALLCSYAYFEITSPIISKMSQAPIS